MSQDARTQGGADPAGEPGAERADGVAPGAGARFECGICWQVYDPALGDPVWQVPAGTGFDALPDHWSCPNCDAPRHKFLPVVEG